MEELRGSTKSGDEKTRFHFNLFEFSLPLMSRADWLSRMRVTRGEVGVGVTRDGNLEVVQDLGD